jgi:hypothetical protein
MTTVAPPVTDFQYLANYLINTRVYGVVVPPDASGNEFFATFEIQGDQGTLTMAAIIGPRGPSGQDAFLLNLQNDALDDPGDLPETLQNTKADIGKAWMFDDVDGAGNIIGSSAYIWYGSAYRRMMLGTPGPPGPIPIITPTVELVPHGEGSTIDVTYQNPKYPQWHLKLDVEEGPDGPAPAMALCPDVDLVTNPPAVGSLLGHLGETTGAPDYHPLWVPVSISQILPGPFSMPESSFTAFTGISQRAAIGSFQIPAQPFPWTPIIWGHIGAFGLMLSANPLMIGCEVRLGDPTSGTLVGRGFGNTMGEVNVMPHYSDPNTPANAITPTNGRAVCPANHSSPAQGTIYVNLYNDGQIGLFQFNPIDAQIFVLIMPVTA